MYSNTLAVIAIMNYAAMHNTFELSLSCKREIVSVELKRETWKDIQRNKKDLCLHNSSSVVVGSLLQQRLGPKTIEKREPSLRCNFRGIVFFFCFIEGQVEEFCTNLAFLFQQVTGARCPDFQHFIIPYLGRMLKRIQRSARFNFTLHEEQNASFYFPSRTTFRNSRTR